jgi:hypothetical protein
MPWQDGEIHVAALVRSRARMFSPLYRSRKVLSLSHHKDAIPRLREVWDVRLGDYNIVPLLEFGRKGVTLTHLY